MYLFDFFGRGKNTRNATKENAVNSAKPTPENQRTGASGTTATVIENGNADGMPSGSAQDPFLLLPYEIILQILEHFTDDLRFLVLHVGLTCRHWNELSYANPCKSLLLSLLGKPLSVLSPSLTHNKLEVWKIVLGRQEVYREAISWSGDTKKSGAVTSNKDLYRKYCATIKGTTPPPPVGLQFSHLCLFASYDERFFKKTDNWNRGKYTIKSLTGHTDFIR